MSRSFRKTPGYGQSKQKWCKKWANRRVRHEPIESVYNHKSYRKLFDSYDIADPYNIKETSKESFIKFKLARYKHESLLHEVKIPTIRELEVLYEKCYLRK